MRRYYEPEAASTARKALNETRLDSRFIRVDMDPGFEEGRQYGRGRAGGQVGTVGWWPHGFSYENDVRSDSQNKAQGSPVAAV